MVRVNVVWRESESTDLSVDAPTGNDSLISSYSYYPKKFQIFGKEYRVK